MPEFVPQLGTQNKAIPKKRRKSEEERVSVKKNLPSTIRGCFQSKTHFRLRWRSSSSRSRRRRSNSSNTLASCCCSRPLLPLVPLLAAGCLVSRLSQKENPSTTIFSSSPSSSFFLGVRSNSRSLWECGFDSSVLLCNSS